MNAPARTGPSIARGKSKQDYETPPDLLDAVVRRFGKLTWDLAATEENAKAPDFFTLEDDSLKEDWTTLRGNAWLNPPFDPIVPWLEQAGTVRDRTAWTLVLAPASPGAEWFADHVEGKCLVIPLRPRVVFVGMSHGFPRDLALYAFGFGLSGMMPSWRWKSAERRKRKGNGP
jgi:phage N-6-adenine-methyltransferase